MGSNVRQGGNGELHHHKLNPAPEPNVRTRDNFGNLQAATGIIDQRKGQDTNHRETSTGQEEKGNLIKVLLLDL